MISRLLGILALAFMLLAIRAAMFGHQGEVPALRGIVVALVGLIYKEGEAR